MVNFVFWESSGLTSSTPSALPSLWKQYESTWELVVPAPPRQGQLQLTVPCSYLCLVTLIFSCRWPTFSFPIWCRCVCMCCVIVAAHVSSAVPLWRSRNGELLMVVTLRWGSNHFLGQQSHPPPCFPPARISSSRWEDLHPKYFPLIYFPSCFLSTIRVSFFSALLWFLLLLFPRTLYNILLQMSERVAILLCGDYDRVFHPQITRAIKICK